MFHVSLGTIYHFVKFQLDPKIRIIRCTKFVPVRHVKNNQLLTLIEWAATLPIANTSAKNYVLLGPQATTLKPTLPCTL